MWTKFISSLIGTIPSDVIDYYKTKRKLKHELKLAKIQGKIDEQTAKNARLAAEQTHVHDWEMTYLGMQVTSSKDEAVLAVFLWPFVGVFIPGVQDYVLQGFDYLAKVPYWWSGVVVTLALAIYGIRHKNAQRINAPGLRKQDIEDTK